MKMVLLSFLLCAFTPQARQSKDWITPIAHIEFDDDIIVYFSGNPLPGYERIKPIYYPFNLMRLIQVDDVNGYTTDVYEFWENFIAQEASGHYFTGINKTDKVIFLKAFAIQSIWSTSDLTSMPGELARNIIYQLCDDNDTEIATSAKLVINLNEELNRLYLEMNQ